MRFGFGRTVAALGAAAMMAWPCVSQAGGLISQISVRHGHAPERVYGEVHRFPEGTRDYSPSTLDGWSFRHELSGGAVREMQITRLGTEWPYLIATDLFANGRFSTMAHTVLLIFGSDDRTWRLVERPAGDLEVLAPDGSTLAIERTGAVRPSPDFRLAPLGAPGTPPRLWHRGFHVRIESVGRSPFLRGTIARVERPDGVTCRLRTEEIFRYDGKPESDRFRFDDEEEFFSFLANRCSGFAPTGPPLLQRAAARETSDPATLAAPNGEHPPSGEAVSRDEWSRRTADTGPVPILVPASTDAGAAGTVTRKTRWPIHGGLFWQLFSY